MRIGAKQRGTAATVLAVMLLLCAGSDGVVPRDSSARVKRIVVLGDSLSEGYLLKRSQAWPMLLVDKLRADGLEYEVVNASRSGDTTSGGLIRLSPQLKSRIDIFVLELGINDAFRGTPIRQIEANLQEIIDRVRKVNPGVAIVICGMQVPNYSGDDYVAQFSQMYVDLAQKNEAALIPSLLEHVMGNPQLNLNDGIHPNPAGHKILVENVWRVLEPIARRIAKVPGDDTMAIGSNPPAVR
jgi:acyl-CoA thioesterase-1